MNYDDLKAKAFTLNGKTYAPIGKDATGRDIYGPVVFCPVAPGVSQQAPLRPLEQGVQKRQKGKGGVEVVVSLVTCRRRELDDDGNVASQKPLRDAIAASLGIDDADKRIRFEYGQSETRAKQGVIVKIEHLKTAEL